MKRILYAWELGGGLGHVSRFVPLARALEGLGCSLNWALSDLTPARVLLAGRTDPVLEAPVFRRLPGPPPGLPPGAPDVQLSFSELLLRHGYQSAATLLPLLTAWRDLITRAAPDLVICDHAPTALLAARSLGLPVARIGTGFCCPPPLAQEPPMMFWQSVEPQRSAATVAQLLASVNGALVALGAKPVADLAQFHAVDEDIVTTYSELDHYPQRNAPRWGVVLGAEAGIAPVWPKAPGKRVFAYLKARQAQTMPLLRALRRKHCAVIAYCPGLSPADRATLAAPGMHFSDAPLDIEQVTREADLVVCGSGHGTVCASLLAGKPVLMAVEMTEQAITAANVERMGAGLALLLAHPERAGALVTRLLTEQSFTRAARAFSQRHGATTQAQIVQAIALRCAELAARPRAAVEG